MKYQPTPRQLKSKRKAYDCLRCGYHWTPYAGKRPRRCARCQSPYWDIPRTKGLPKPPEGPEEADPRADRFGWKAGDLTITHPDGTQESV